MIVATAGHVDHGKTELIRALTGTDTDRLPEEKQRGLSIDLGFAYQTLSGDVSLGFVDVPGHEKFIRNMLAGVGGIDMGLLVVAADDGVMPQTGEHLAILDLLGIEEYRVALTKIDRVDEDRIVEVKNQVQTLLAHQGIEAAAVHPVCAPQDRGIAALKAALHEQARQHRARTADGCFRMAVDRVFTLKGVGLVVTGMVLAGAARIDDQLLLSSDGSPARVRGIHANGIASETARAGQRCALNLAGRHIDENRARRGDWLIHENLYAPTRRIDVDLRVLESESKPLKHWTPTHLHIGSARLPARVAVLEGGSIAAGAHGYAQLVLEDDIFVLHGDRFVLRDQSARRTMAGGQVIDPFSPKRGRARPGRIASLRAMNRSDPAGALDELAACSEAGVPLAAFALSNNLPPARLDMLVEDLSLHRIGTPTTQRVFSKTQWQALLDRVELAVAGFHQSRPEQPGATLRDIQLRVKPHLETNILEHAIQALVRTERLGQRGARLHLPTHEMPVSGQDQQLWDDVEALLAPPSGSPLSLHQAAETLGVEPKLLEKSLKTAVRHGRMVQIAKNRYLPARHLARLGFEAETLAASAPDGCFTAAAYCEHAETGRNFAIELLEYFDRLGFTRRTGNQRRIQRTAASVFRDHVEGG